MDFYILGNSIRKRMYKKSIDFLQSLLIEALVSVSDAIAQLYCFNFAGYYNRNIILLNIVMVLQ